MYLMVLCCLKPARRSLPGEYLLPARGDCGRGAQDGAVEAPGAGPNGGERGTRVRLEFKLGGTETMSILVVNGLVVDFSLPPPPSLYVVSSSVLYSDKFFARG